MLRCRDTNIHPKKNALKHEKLSSYNLEVFMVMLWYQDSIFRMKREREKKKQIHFNATDSILWNLSHENQTEWLGKMRRESEAATKTHLKQWHLNKYEHISTFVYNQLIWRPIKMISWHKRIEASKNNNLLATKWYLWFILLAGRLVGHFTKMVGEKKGIHKQAN